MKINMNKTMIYRVYNWKVHNNCNMIDIDVLLLAKKKFNNIVHEDNSYMIKFSLTNVFTREEKF